MMYCKPDVDYSPSSHAAFEGAGAFKLLRLCVGAAALAVLLACAQPPTASTAESAPQEVAVAPPPETVAALPVAPVSAPAAATAPIAAAPIPLPAAPALTEPKPPVVAPALPAPTPQKLVITAALTPGYYVHVGAFAVPDNANKAYQKLREAGMSPVAQTLTQRKRALTRVGAGPFPTRAAAQAAAKKIAAIPLDTLISKH